MASVKFRASQGIAIPRHCGHLASCRLVDGLELGGQLEAFAMEIQSEVPFMNRWLSAKPC